MLRPCPFLPCSDRLDNLRRLGKVIHGFNEKVPGGGIDHTRSGKRCAANRGLDLAAARSSINV